MSLEARGLAYGYPGRVVGRGVELSLAEAEVVALLGPNGGGKTTLLRTLLGLLAPLAGEVTLDGRALSQWPLRDRATRLAYVPQAAESYFDSACWRRWGWGAAPIAASSRARGNATTSARARASGAWASGTSPSVRSTA